MANLDKRSLQKIHRACALQRRGGDAPIVKWYAEGDAAKRLVDLAKSQGVTIEEGQAEDLLLALKSVKLDTFIPKELYLAMARLYAYLIEKKERGE